MGFRARVRGGQSPLYKGAGPFLGSRALPHEAAAAQLTIRNMRALFIVIVVAAAGYLGYWFFMNKDSVLGARTVSGPASAPPAAVEKSAAAAPAGPAKRLAPIGIYYTLERISVETSSGLVAVHPGTKVNLLARKPGGKLRLSDGAVDFVVNETQVTNDLDVAEAVAKKHPAPAPGK